MSADHLTQQKFSDLALPGPVLKGVEEAGFTYCTPIQAEALPPALAGQDVAGQAQTGTGKTATFLLATFNRLMAQPAAPERRPTQVRALILAPTRELAIQIHRDAEVLGKHTGLSLALIYGGTGYEQQRKTLEAGTDVLIGTPGRVIDYFKQGVFDLKALQVFVLDEADRMFDLGFIKDVRYLLRRMPPAGQRLSMLFSATLSYRVSELAYEHMNNPQLVKVAAEKLTVEAIREVVYYPAMEEKIPLLLGLLKKMDPTRSLVFVNTKSAAEKVWAYLEGNSIQAAVLSGDVPQNKREQLLGRFRDGELPVLVATDVAARGLHIPEVSHVFNYDLPQDSEDYVHRIGRTARAGASGDAVSFACEAYAYSLIDIQDYIGHEIPMATVTEDLLVKPEPPVRRERRPRRDAKGGSRRHGQGGGRSGERSRRERGKGPGAPRPRARSEAGPETAEPERKRPEGKRKKDEAGESESQAAAKPSRETPAIG
jgi:ATP-dependent RNA helicase RhlB